LITDAKVIYYIGTAIRANGDLPFRFLSPRTGGTEGGVKTIEERLGEKGGAFFNGKEGRDDFRKSLILKNKIYARHTNHNHGWRRR